MKPSACIAAVIAVSALTLTGCATTREVSTTYSPGGEVTEHLVREGDQVLEEVRRVFSATNLTGEGMFEHANEGLARQSALSLAQADLAQKVQSQVRGNTVIWNNQDARSVVETSVNALVRDYSIEYAGFDPGTSKYRVRISVAGEQLVREVARQRVPR